MRIIKPSYEIEVPPGYFEWVIPHIERAIRTCYKSEDKIEEGSAEKIINKILESKHMSTIEHGGFSVRFIVDRGVSHELVRHRLASFSQESTRYCNYNKDKFGNEITVIQPCWIEQDLTGSWTTGRIMYIHEDFENNLPTFTLTNENTKERLEHGDRFTNDWVNSCFDTETQYFRLLKTPDNPDGWTPQQARSVLPNSLKTEVVMTANFREWRTVLEQRTAKAAHPQIKEVCVPLLEELKTLVPVIFDDIETK